MQETIVDDGPRYQVLRPDCPSRVILARIGEKWTLLVLLSLRTETKRFSALRDDIGTVTPKVLTETLRALERDGLVSREAFAEMPPRVEYRLTALGRSLLEPIQAVRRWAEDNVQHILDAREQTDEAVESGQR